MRKIVLLTIMIFIIGCGGSSFTKEELIGTYVANERLGDDTIIILDSTKYVHLGIRECDNTRFSDTGRWKMYTENEMFFNKFIRHTGIDISIDTCSSSWFPEIFLEKNKICLNVGADAGLYYIKQ